MSSSSVKLKSEPGIAVSSSARRAGESANERIDGIESGNEWWGEAAAAAVAIAGRSEPRRRTRAAGRAMEERARGSMSGGRAQRREEVLAGLECGWWVRRESWPVGDLRRRAGRQRSVAGGASAARGSPVSHLHGFRPPT